MNDETIHTISKTAVCFALIVTFICSCIYFYITRQYNPKVLAKIENYSFTKEVLDELITPENRHRFVFEPNYNILTFPNLLSPEQCDELMQVASRSQGPSELQTDTPYAERDEVRKSKTSWLTSDQTQVDTFITNWIISYLKPYFPNVDEGWMEKLQVVEYEPNGKFLEHWDNSWKQDVHNPKSQVSEARGTQKSLRLVTFLFYLTEDYEGGETIFPLLKRGVKGKKGMCLVFYNIDPYTKLIIAESLHIANRVRRGKKWIATKWVRLGTT